MQNETYLKKIILFMIYAAPTVHLAFGMRFGDFINILSILCLVYLYQFRFEKEIYNKKLFYFFSLTFFVYPLEIFISQFLRWHWYLHEYLDQIRFIFIFPVFLYLIINKINFVEYIEKAVPVALILAFITTKYIFFDNQYGGRFTNNFTDPLAFGQICMSMALLLIVTFIYSERMDLLHFTYKIIGIFFGCYISIKSQSRTGWFAIFPTIILLLYLSKYNWSIKKSFILLGTIVLLSLLVYSNLSIVNSRIYQAINEVKQYPWHGGIAPDTSVGLRLTFYRIGWFYIVHNPWYGMGDRGFYNLTTSDQLRSFASPFAIKFCFGALFHDELLTQTVRYGLLGILGYIIIFIIPIIILFKNVFHDNLNLRGTSVLGIVFLVSQMVAGISDEVLNLKYMVLYFALLISICFSNFIIRKTK